MIFLGIDGGGTKTAFALISADGEILAHTTRGTSHPDQIGMDAVRSVLQDGANTVCEMAGYSLADVTYSVWGLPGFGENLDHAKQLEQLVGDIIGNDRYYCCNDVEVGWAGSLACQPGIHLVAGTGAIGFGRDLAGQVARSSGWSEVFGDEGSAYWLGRRVLELFSKQSDYRLPKTPLYELTKAKLDLKRDLDLVGMMSDMGTRGEIAQLARIASQAAEAGDVSAAELFRDAAYEHSLTVKAIIKQLSFLAGKSIPVSYSGGVFRSGEWILAPLKEFLQETPVTLQEPKLEPIIGACLYAFLLHGNEITNELVQALAQKEKELGI